MESGSSDHVRNLQPPGTVGPTHQDSRQRSNANPSPDAGQRIDAAAEWRHGLTGLTLGLLLFETITGLTIYLLDFSVFNQFAVLWHTLIGVVMLVPIGWYLLRHWLLRFRGKFNHYQLLGYLTAALLIALFVSGFVLTGQVVFGTRISYGWDLVHLVTGLVFVFAVLAHTLMLWYRRVYAADTVSALRAGKRSFLIQFAVAAGILFAMHVGSMAAYREQPLHNEFPADYSWKFGKDRPFAPSLVRTASNWAYGAESLAGSTGCGTSGCHSQIYREWEPSAHRYASSDVAFQAVQRLMLNDTGAESTRYCAGCHDPVALLSGHKNVNVEGLTSVGAEDGVSCVVCHSIVQTDVRGNADYTVAQSVRYVGELKEGAWNKWISDFLIRAYPQHHIDSFARPLYKTAEYCGACHKQFIDEEVNQIGWVQLQNQYDNWRKSRWYHEGDPTKTVTCRECHMPLHTSTDPAAGDESDYNRNVADNRHRSHRFLAANQVMPLLMKLPGAAKHVELTEAWLRGEIQVPEIAEKWTSGPVIRLELSGPEKVKPGDEVKLQIILTNNKTGHGFPTGPLDIIRSWVEITVEDQDGRVVYQMGKPDEQGKMDENTLVFKADGIDRYGNDIDRHNLWEMVGARFKRALFPGTSDSETFSFLCPGFSAPPKRDVHTDTQALAFNAPIGLRELNVTAVLNYQKADAVFLDRLFGVDAGIRTPITMISQDSMTIHVEQ